MATVIWPWGHTFQKKTCWEFLELIRHTHSFHCSMPYWLLKQLVSAKYSPPYGPASMAVRLNVRPPGLLRVSWRSSENKKCPPAEDTLKSVSPSSGGNTGQYYWTIIPVLLVSKQDVRPWYRCTLTLSPPSYLSFDPNVHSWLTVYSHDSHWLGLLKNAV